MERYIRLDVKGTWKGNKHQSRSAAWYYDEDDKYLENGVSCYKLDVDGFKDLMNYSIHNMSITTNEDIDRMQVTVFEGEWSGKGSDGEELAWCKETITETDFLPIFKKLCILDIRQEGYYNEEIDDYEDELTDEEYDELVEALEDEEITNDEFDNEIEKIIAGLQ